MARVTVGSCSACGRELRVKEGAVRPRMRLTCTCGCVNDVGQDLSELSPAERVQLLLDCLDGRDGRISPEVCAGELERLLRQGDDDVAELRSSIGRLCDLAKRDEVPDRRVLIRSLGTLGEPAAVDDLVQILQSDRRANSRADAARSLGNIFYQTYVQPFLERASREQLTIVRGPYSLSVPRRTEYDEYDERSHDIVLVELHGGDEQVIEAIGGAATRDPDSDVRRHAVRTLRGLKHQSGRTYLEQAKSDSDVDVQRIAAEALSELDAALGQYALEPA